MPNPDEHSDTVSSGAAPVQPGTVRVLICDDHPMMATALRTYVDSAPGMQCVGQARDGETAVQMAGELHPDIVLMDLHMPVMGGIEATRLIRQRYPDVAVLAVTTFSTELYVIPALRAGAGGYFLKDSEPEQIIEAIREVHEGVAAFSPTVARQLMLSVKNEPSQVETALLRFPEAPHIPARELEGLQLLATGCSNAEIAEKMLVSEATVKVYMGRIMQRLDVRDRVQLLIRGVELGLVEPSLS
ncbi:response regulator transcription factor [Nesterenkonia natronophila]|uniref:DNA-binding response regulator n=1 Tax=Nesterenkonia natronophila TaxID=2174932 RepID=A0A3A4F2I8_9MICC|nr:response regulator transcription factor [Nesterenkonia natronophila]RJN31941.1 DNA-binding response regulator [Nesterenkonia natronophila]